MRAKDIVLTATAELFDERDLAAVDRHWAAGYVEHSTLGAPGLDGLRRTAGSLPPGFRHEKLRVLAQDDLVVAHGLYHGLGPEPVVGCDVWRVEDGKVVEHWDAHQPWVGETVSGHSMVDGPAQITEPESTASSRAVVEGFVDLIMMGRDRSQIARFFDGDRFIQHNPHIADGVSGLGSAIQSGVWEAVIERAHRIVADGEFVFTQGEGRLHGKPAAFYDIFRVEDGTLAEHWDVVFHAPETLPHTNGLF
jgi:predicted SnoaL-like aldol condensation-catalyzing enzyme